jgi:hypothetical protein
MIDIKVDRETWDVDTTGGDIQLIEGLDEVIQAVEIALMMVYSEWKFAPTQGVKWNRGMFDINVPHIQKISWIRETIIGVRGVLEVNEVTLAIDAGNRGGIISFRAKSIYGPIEGEVVVKNGNN